jgi:hypothetical protein
MGLGAALLVFCHFLAGAEVTTAVRLPLCVLCELL